MLRSLLVFALSTTSSADFYRRHHHHHEPHHRPGYQSYSSTPWQDPLLSNGQTPQLTTSDGSISFPQEFGGGMKVLYSWKQVDFEFPDPDTRRRMIQNQQFIPINNLILDVDVYDSGRGRVVFVTLPRVRPGVPVTLATVGERRNGRGEALLRPFPDWRANTAFLDGDCDSGITSVFRTHVDECGRLWVLDSGCINAFNGNSSIPCDPKVLIYDLRNNNRMIGRYPIPRSLIEDGTVKSLLVTIAVDVRNRDCGSAYAYIADSLAYKMIVFDLRSGGFWRVNSILFYPYPDQSRFTINGVSFNLMGGVFGLSISPQFRGNRRLYFQCIDSVRQSWVDTDLLRNGSVWQANMNASPGAFNLFSGSRSSQSAAATMSDQGVMFFGLIRSNEIACWNSQRTFNRANIVSLAKDDETLQFNSGIKVYSGKLYAATCRLQNYLNNLVNPDEINYRLLVGDVDQLTEGTSCQVDLLFNRINDDYTPDSDIVNSITGNSYHTF